MENSRDRKFQAWVLVLGVLLILSLCGLAIVVAVWQASNNVQQAFKPVNDVTSNIGTQVAQALHPTPTVLPDPVTVIRDIRSLSRLETIQYTVEKVITAQTNQGTFGFLFGDKLLFVAHGIVIAGVDLGKMQPQDLSVQNDVLYVKLPDPEVFVATLDNQKSYVYNRDTGVLTRGDTNLETTARQAAEEEIKKAALEDGILTQAQQNAESYLYRMFLALGYQDVIFTNSGATNPPPTLDLTPIPGLSATPTPTPTP
jgi:hypothetical protein